MQLQRTLSESEIKGTAKYDEQPYIDIIQKVIDSGDAGALITLDAGDSQTETKTRLTRAAHAVGKNLRWRSSPQGTLKFVLSDRNEKEENERKQKAKDRAAQRKKEQEQANGAGSTGRKSDAA
jgi:hypothetical protein